MTPPQQLRLPGFEHFAIPDWISWNHAGDFTGEEPMDWAWVSGKDYTVYLPWWDSSTVLVLNSTYSVSDFGVAPESATSIPADVIRTVLPVREWTYFRGYAIRIIEAFVRYPHLFDRSSLRWTSMEVLAEAIEIAPLALSRSTPLSKLERLCTDEVALRMVRVNPVLQSDRRLMLAAQIGHLFPNDPRRLSDYLDALTDAA